ncbi:hypothetical protein [Sandarakinorhabdus sp. DWP1-3-1]|uniref:hypothetical protein n=1 Tax=Sandarakinorhabdus sp. DWP1-3-1 TaxID=2804627 RepID=UPI003CF66FE1
MALIALIASVIGAATAMAMLGWGIHILWRGGWLDATQVQRIAAIAYISYGLLGLAFVTITALGMAINRRSIKVDGPGGTSVDISGGSDDAAAATVTTTTATTVTPTPAALEG